MDRLFGLGSACQVTFCVNFSNQGEDEHELPAKATQLGLQTLWYGSPISGAQASKVAVPRAKRRSFPNALSE